MTTIHNEDGTLNYVAAAQQTASAAGVTNPASRAAILDAVTAAAWVDIAASLRALVGLAGSDPLPLNDDEEDEEEEDDGIAFEVGDWVAANVGDDVVDPEPFEVLDTDTREGEAVINLGAGYLFARNFHKVAAPAVKPTEVGPPNVDPFDDDEDAERCGAIYTSTDSESTLNVACAKAPGHSGKHRKGNLKW